MIRKIRTSLKFKLFLLFFVLNLSGVLLTGFFSYQSKRSALTEQAKDSLSIIAAQLAGKVDMFINERLVYTRAMALDYEADVSNATGKERQKFLSRYLTINPYYERIRFISIEDAKKAGDAMVPSGYEGTWYLPALKGVVISSDMYVSPLSGRPTMSFAAPVTDPNGRIISIMTADLKADYLWDIIDSVGRENKRNGLTGYAYVVNDNGLIIAHPDKELIFKRNLFASRAAGVDAMARDMVKGRAGTASYTDRKGIAKVVAYAPCKGYGDYDGHGWSIAVTKDYSELLYPMKRLLRIYLALFAVTSLAVLVVSTKLANYLVKPIRSLKDGASKIGEGNFGMRIETDAQNEIGDLAGSFNRMAEALEARDDQLKEYTRSLTDMNRELRLKQEELSRANQSLKKTNDELVRLEKQKAEWSAMITHDIKSPLSTILAYAEMVLDGTVSREGDDLKKAVSGIHASGSKILSLVDNYLVSSAIEAGKLQLKLQPLDINLLIEDDLPFFRPQAERKDMTLIFEKAEGLPRVLADKVQLDRAISNIVTNAIKYSPNGSPITITTRKEEKGISISVTDKGKGIAEDDIQDLFDKYSRSKETARIKGTGLGLFIARAIAEAHGGRITVKSRPGEGSTFTIQIPATEK